MFLIVAAAVGAAVLVAASVGIGAAAIWVGELAFLCCVAVVFSASAADAVGSGGAVAVAERVGAP